MKKILILGITFCAALLSVSHVLAQGSGVNPGETLSTSPKDRPNTLTLTIPDEIPPSVPILIAPANNSYVTTATPGFSWEESTDNIAMGSYSLYLDGSILFSGIPLTPTTTSQYTLTKVANLYTLTPTSALSQGSHTWKIQAADASSNTRDSATWAFTIDTNSPTFVITNVGEDSTSISAQDLSTLPNPYQSITTNEPTISGTAESSSVIQLTLETPGQSNQLYTFSTSSGGSWSVTFPILPRDSILTMNFIITDLAGNVTVLNDVYFLIEQLFVFNSPTASPTTTVPAGTTTPISTVEPGVSPSITPASTPTTPFEGVIPNIIDSLPPIPTAPPKEIATNFFQALIPQEIINAIPEVIRESVQTVSRTIAPYGSAILVSAVPFTATAIAATQFGWSISLQLILRILQAFGILPTPEPQGLVFDSETEKPVPFALLNVQKIGDLSTTETLVTSVDGIYGGVSLSAGKYKIEVRHQDYSFPTTKNRPSYLTRNEFYKGEEFEIASESKQQLFLIPIDPKINQSNQEKSWFNWHLIQERLYRLAGFLTLPLFVISVLITIFYTTVINIVICIVYTLILFQRMIKALRLPRLTGKVINTQGEPLSQAFIRIYMEASSQLAALVLTDKNGEFKAFVPKGNYQLSLTKPEYIWVEDGQVQTFFMADVRRQRQHIVAVMQDAEDVYSMFFTDTDPVS